MNASFPDFFLSILLVVPKYVFPINTSPRNPRFFISVPAQQTCLKIYHLENGMLIFFPKFFS